MKQNKIFAIALLLLCAVAVSACTSSSALTGNQSWPGLASEGGTVYSANGSFVEAIRDGQKVWSYPESANNRLSFFASPAVDETHVYAGTFSNQLHVLNKEDGTLAVSVEVGNNKNKIIASPIVADGNVIVLSSGGMVSSYPTAISGETPTPNWQTTLSGELWVKPVFYNGTLYVASMDKKMNLLDAANGELKESIDISGAIMSDPVLSDGRLYFSTLAKEVEEMDLATNERRVMLTTDGEIWASPLLMGDKLIAADMNGVVYCIDAASDKQLWKTDKLTADKFGFIASPAAMNESTFLLVDETGEIMTYDLEGKSVGQRTLSQTVCSTPVILENGNLVLLPVSTDGQVKAYTPDLREDWVYTRTTEKESKK